MVKLAAVAVAGLRQACRLKPNNSRPDTFPAPAPTPRSTPDHREGSSRPARASPAPRRSPPTGAPRSAPRPRSHRPTTPAPAPPRPARAPAPDRRARTRPPHRLDLRRRWQALTPGALASRQCRASEGMRRFPTLREERQRRADGGKTGSRRGPPHGLEISLDPATLVPDPTSPLQFEAVARPSGASRIGGALCHR